MADEVHVSVSFTWDLVEGRRLVEAWSRYYPVVRLGGPAVPGDVAEDFVPGRYVGKGVLMTSRGCNNKCPWCLVHGREGALRELPVQEGWILQDNNLLQCSQDHQMAVYEMLRRVHRQADFRGGLQASLVDGFVAAWIRQLWMRRHLRRIWFAADTNESLKALEEARRAVAFLERQEVCVYVLIGFEETVADAERRLRKVFELNCSPYAMLYQPPEAERLEYSLEWTRMARVWSRPLMMHRFMREGGGSYIGY